MGVMNRAACQRVQAYIAQEVEAELRDAVTRKVQDMFPEINLPDLLESFFEEGQRLYVSQRYSDAANSWGRAVDLKQAHAHVLLADMLFWGKPDVPADHKRAFELASAGAGMGCVHSKGVLGCCYVYGRGVAEDRAKGLELGRESAAAGCCMGQFVVGKCYDAGWDVAQDDAEAVRFYRLAAEQGHAVAQCNLGCMFDKGRGVAQDDAEAVRFWRLAATQGYSRAQCNLGLMFSNGQGVAQDRAVAVTLFRLAAAQGDAGAIEALRQLGA